MGFAIGVALWLLAQVDAAGPRAPAPPDAVASAQSVATPWPTELPCAHPRTVWLAGRIEGTFYGRPAGALSWSSADGAETLSLELAKTRSRHRLRGDLPVGHLVRLAGPPVDANLTGMVFGVECAGGGGVIWGPCAAGVCAVSATYRAHPLPKSKQPTRRWTIEIPGSPWTDITRDVHFTRFHRDIALKKDGDPDAAHAALRFAHAFATELREALAAACLRGRCTAVVGDASAVLASYLRDPAPTHEHGADQRVDNWNYAWSWTATGGNVSLRIACDDTTAPPDLGCELNVDLPGEITLEYRTNDREIAIYPAADRKHKTPIGRITGAADDGNPPTISIEGRLLAAPPRAS